MKQRVSLKLLVLFGIICTTFFVAESKLHAATVANKSSTFSTQLNNRDDDGGNDSELAEKIRAQRAAIEARENRDAATTQTKTSAKQNNCDNDLRKCISAQCGANYKKCETDSDITFSDKLTACRKETTCTAHEFTLFTNEIKEDKKQAIDLAMYNTVIDCGNSYNDCIIQQCGPKFNKCLSKSNGDNAITACKQIAQNCTEADSGLVGRVGNVFGIVRQDAEKQIKADETKLQQLRDKMRSSCRATGAMFDDRTLDCVFNVSFYAGDDQKTPKASRKLYAGSLFDCTPDWFGIDVTTFKENAYRLTRSQTAASSAMLGAGVGTAVGAVTSGAIGRAIDTKKAKDALKEECEKAGKKLKDGKCEDTIISKGKQAIATTNQLDDSLSGARVAAGSVALEAAGVPAPLATSAAQGLENTRGILKDGANSALGINNTTNGFGESTRSGFDNASLGVDMSLGGKPGSSNTTSSIGGLNNSSLLGGSGSKTSLGGLGGSSSGSFGGGLGGGTSSSNTPAK